MRKAEESDIVGLSSDSVACEMQIAHALGRDNTITAYDRRVPRHAPRFSSGGGSEGEAGSLWSAVQEHASTSSFLLAAAVIAGTNTPASPFFTQHSEAHVHTSPQTLMLLSVCDHPLYSKQPPQQTESCFSLTYLLCCMQYPGFA